MGFAQTMAAAAALTAAAGCLGAQDARELLERVSATYEQLESGRFEWLAASETRTRGTISKNEIHSTVAFARPDKVKVVIDYGDDSAWVRLSDGQDLIRYRSASGDVNKEPFSGDIARILNSTRIGSYQSLTSGLKSVKVAGSEVLRVGNSQFDCHVVEAQYEPRFAMEGNEPLPTRFWIDKQRLIVLREASGSRSGETENTETVTFTVAEIGTPVPAAEFVFAKR